MILRVVSRFGPPSLRLASKRFSFLKRLFTRESQQPRGQREKQEGPDASDKAKQQEQEKQQKEVPPQYRRKLESHSDFADLKRKHSKHIPENIGAAGFEQVLFWSDGAINFSELVLLARAFNKVWERLPNRAAPESYQFEEFAKKLIKSAGLCHNLQDIYVFSQFGKLYGVSDPSLWSSLEEKFCAKLSSSSVPAEELSVAVGIVMNFALLKQGDEIYNRAEQLVTYFSADMTVEDVSRLLAALHNTRKGTAETVAKLVAEFLGSLEKASKQSIVLVTPVLRFIEGVNEEVYSRLDQHILKSKIAEELSVYELGEIAKGFGYSRGSDALWQSLQKQMLTQQLNIETIDSVVLGFLSAYRCSLKLVEKAAEFIRQNLKSIHPRILSEAAKDFYMYEVEDKALYEGIQGSIMEYLSNPTQVDLQDLLIITKNYCLTRHGSRDIYRMLEEVIIVRINDIKMERFVFEALMTVYNNSELCSVDLHNLFRLLS